VPVLNLPGRYYRMYPSIESPLGHATEVLHLNADNTALLIVDVYGLGFDEAGDDADQLAGIYQPDPVMRTIIRDHIRPVKDAARRAGLPTIYLTNHLSPGLDAGNEWRNMSLRTCDVDVLEAWREPNPILAHSKVIAPDDQDVVIRKQMYSGFFETSLDSTLRNRGITNLVMVGFDSRICLGTTAVDAIYRNYRVIVLRDCVRTMEFPDTRDGEWANLMAIRQIETNVGYTSTSAEFLAACEPVTDSEAS
jgi:nicotinamidase-related amidase